jgi:hypothetical protein
MRQMLRAGPALVAVLLVACGRSPLESDDVTLDATDSGGLPTKTLDAGIDEKDSGLGTKDDDSGLDTKDSGPGFEDAGPATSDAGPGTVDAGPVAPDAGPGTVDAGPVTPDAGPGAVDAGPVADAGPGTIDAGAPDAGGILGCLDCAGQKCGPRVNACVSSSACIAEGMCDRSCLTGSGSGRGPGAFGGLNFRCFESCTKDQQANQELLQAVSCAFASCPQECLGALTPFTGGGGGLGGIGGH